MKTEHELAIALRTMMSEVSLDDISVTSLTKKCHVNRKTFYYHFHDIYDLLTQVFLDETIPGVLETKDINQLMKVIYNYYAKNSKFVDATLNSAGKDLFQEFIYNTCYTNFLRYIVALPEGKKIHSNDRKYIARFYAFAYSNSIVYYLSNYKSKTFTGLMNCFSFENKNCLEKAVIKVVAEKGKTQQ
ncbi:MAG: TetR/AcrR family transcriptional regulator [Bacilli bacterium]|nr:TetR/AcrR family transcriptional regulator [Bacilli bacterium]